jgi:hypothetical protein
MKTIGKNNMILGLIRIALAEVITKAGDAVVVVAEAPVVETLFIVKYATGQGMMH